MKLRPKHTAAGMAVAGFLAFGFIGPALMTFDNDWIHVTMLVIGVYVGQVNLIATWGALGLGNFMVRLPWSILLGMMTWYSLVLGYRVWRPSEWRDDDFVVLGVVLIGGIVLAQVPLWIAGKSFRWRLIDIYDPQSRPVEGPLQFNLWHMLLVMVFVALGLGPARLVLPSLSMDRFHMEGTMLVILAAVVVTNLVMTVPCIWGALVRSNPVPMVAWPFYCALVTAIEFGILCAILGSPGPDSMEVALAFLVLNLSQCATVYFTLRIFRALGFRLVQRPQSAASPPASDDGCVVPVDQAAQHAPEESSPRRQLDKS